MVGDVARGNEEIRTSGGSSATRVFNTLELASADTTPSHQIPTPPKTLKPPTPAPRRRSLPSTSTTITSRTASPKPKASTRQSLPNVLAPPIKDALQVFEGGEVPLSAPTLNGKHYFARRMPSVRNFAAGGWDRRVQRREVSGEIGEVSREGSREDVFARAVEGEEVVSDESMGDVGVKEESGVGEQEVAGASVLIFNPARFGTPVSWLRQRRAPAASTSALQPLSFTTVANVTRLEAENACARSLGSLAENTTANFNDATASAFSLLRNKGKRPLWNKSYNTDTYSGKVVLYLGSAAPGGSVNVGDKNAKIDALCVVDLRSAQPDFTMVTETTGQNLWLPTIESAFSRIASQLSIVEKFAADVQNMRMTSKYKTTLKERDRRQKGLASLAASEEQVKKDEELQKRAAGNRDKKRKRAKVAAKVAAPEAPAGEE
ncbi:hypothetical protein HK097_004244 [Rhizophlyctis rosea]|uniref:Uncharacterized protein n=1 Tax=Rhizophlyctis rosea TaxID=64517 RepID=A0AAD5S371_9FUNG|nr:hypothetical protein HK097_004244 [Rhizophlyctis rosea]